VKIPREFRDMVLRMNSDPPDFSSMKSDNEVIEYFVSSVGIEERGPIVSFLDRVLAADLDQDDLAQMWVEAGSDRFVLKGIIPFLTMLRDELKSSLA
jgi:hypothetical protein